MTPTVRLMVLASPVPDGLPRILIDEGGLWRETQPFADAQSKLKAKVEAGLAEILKAIGGPNPVPLVPRTNGKFRSAFRALMQAVVPTDVRDALARAAADADPTQPPPRLEIHLAPGTDWIPWELLFDGEDFLGLRFAIARLPFVKRPTNLAGERTRRVRRVHNLLGQHVLDPALQAEWEQTFAAHTPGPGWEQRAPNGHAGYPRLDAIHAAMDADILHLTCHGGVVTSQGDTCWTLDHTSAEFFNYELDLTFAEGLELSCRPLVFGNACSSIGAALDFANLQGFGAAFLSGGGALDFIGTFAPVVKRTAIAFATRFYKRLFAKLPIAEALRQTKASFAAEDWPDPSYLFYCLYGPPDITYEVAADDDKPPSPPG